MRKFIFYFSDVCTVLSKLRKDLACQFLKPSVCAINERVGSDGGMKKNQA